MVCTGTPFYFLCTFLYGMRSDSFRTDREVTLMVLARRTDREVTHAASCRRSAEPFTCLQ
jgi:hypothetical protein